MNPAESFKKEKRVTYGEGFFLSLATMCQTVLLQEITHGRNKNQTISFYHSQLLSKPHIIANMAKFIYKWLQRSKRVTSIHTNAQMMPRALGRTLNTNEVHRRTGE